MKILLLVALGLAAADGCPSVVPQLRKPCWAMTLHPKRTEAR